MAKRDRTQTLRWLREGTQRRRESRGRRKRTLTMIIAVMLLMLILGAPSLLCFSPLIHSVIDSAVKPYGWKVKVEDVRIGWITPLKLTGIDAVGPSGKSVLVADMLDASITILDLLAGKSDYGTINIDAPRLEMEVFESGTSLEDDIQAFLASDQNSAPINAKFVLRDAVVKVNRRESELAWRIDQLQATVEVAPHETTADVAGVITDPEGVSGAVATKLKLPSGEQGIENNQPIEASVSSEGLPLSLLSLAAVRFPELSSSLPESWSGNATGQLVAKVGANGEFQLLVSPIDLRNLIVQDPRITGDKAWKVGHALATGSTSMQGETLKFEQFKVVTDAGEVSLDGLIDLKAIEAEQYLDAMLGDFAADFDLAALTQAAPGLIPVRGDVEIQSGRIKAEVRGEYGDDQDFRSSWILNTEPITAILASGQRIVLDPVTSDIVLKPSKNWVTADKLVVKSSFGEAIASGDLDRGEVQFNLDFQRLATTLRSILDLPPSSLGGVASGEFQWAVSGDQIWRLSGNAKTQDLVISIPGMTPIRRPALNLQLEGEGLWGDGKLARLNKATFQLTEPQQQWNVSLTQSVVDPSNSSFYPLSIKGNGDLQTLSLYANSVLPESVTYIDGKLQTDLACKVSANRFHLDRADLAINNLSIVVDQQLYRQDTVKAHFEGSYLWPENALRAQTLTVSGNAASFIAQGDYGPGLTKLELAYRTDLQRLASAMVMPLPAPPSDGVEFAGTVEGRIEIETLDKNTRIDVTADAKNFAVHLPGDRGDVQVLWREPQFSSQANLTWAESENSLYVRKITTTLPWLNSALAGKVNFTENGHNAALEGDAEFDVEVVSDRLTTLIGEPIKLTGKHNTPLRVAFSGDADSKEVVDIVGSIGWNSAQVSGVTAGPADVPLRITADTIFVDPASIPIQQGLVHLAGQVHYQAQPLWFEQSSGKFAEGIKLTPDMCRGWLKYMLPIAADTTDVNGSFSLELAECKVIPSDPVNSRVVGTLNVEGASVGPGPLTKNLIATIDQLQAATKGLQGQPIAPSTSNKQWIQLDPQAVDFSLIGGQVTHQRLQMRIDKANLISSGSVFLDGRLNLRLQLPLESTWLGSDLKGLAGRQITIPVGGTLSRPAVDNQAVVSALSQVGAQAIQSNAENFLQKQLDRQLQKLFKN